MAGNPKASSTPKIIDLKCRNPIRYEDSVVSPIEKRLYISETPSVSDHSDKDSDTDTSTQDAEEQAQKISLKNVATSVTTKNAEDEKYEVDDKYKHQKNLTSPDNKQHNTILFIEDGQTTISLKTLIGISGLLIIVAIWVMWSNSEGKSKPLPHPPSPIGPKLDELFPSQEEDFGLKIQVNIEDIQAYKQPKSIIFLYEESSKETLNRILKTISEEAVCRISSCSEDPLEIKPSDISTSDILEDYGRIISKYKDTLEKSGVMIVRNLEKIPGTAAQAFHSLCDEYNPVVNKALFLFTIKVPEIPKQANHYTRKYLGNKWTELDETKFAPLFTRISSGFIMSVMQEKTNL